jgi:trigger factor
MKVIQEKLPASQIGLEIEITPEMSKQAYEKTLQEFTRSANIPGFRKGKVPRQVLIQRFGTTRIKAAVVEDLIENSLKKAVEQEKIEAIGSFELKSSFEQLVSQFEPGSPLTFSAAVDVPPEVKLNEYKGLTVQAEEVKYDPAKVDEVLENYRSRSATLVPIEGRPAQKGDTAVVDFAGRLAKSADAAEDAEPEEIPGGSATDFEIELLEGRFIEGFIDGIIGMSAGETKDVTATFPEGYPQENLSGRDAVFTVTLKELKEKELPELDDDFAQDVSEFETLAELRESLEKRFQEEAEEKTKANKQEALLNELVKHLDVDLPATLVKQEVDYLLTQTAMRLSNQGIDVRQMFTPELVQNLRERSRPEAVTRLQRTLVLGEIAKKESLQVSQPEVNAKVQEVRASLPEEQQYDPERLRQIVEEDLIRDKIFGWLEENSTIELVPEGSLTPAEPEVEVSTAADVEAPEAATEAATIDVTQTPEVDPSDAELADADATSAEKASAETSKKTSKSTKKSTKKSAADAEESEQSSDSEEA